MTHPCIHGPECACTRPAVEPLAVTVARLSVELRALSDRVDWLEEQRRTQRREP